jgi:hypothetical protein
MQGGVLKMFVVHTINQLEEAIRVGAEEILVTGMLANNVRETNLSKTYKDGVAVPGHTMSEESRSEEACEETDVRVKGGMPSVEVSTLLFITSNYETVVSRLDPIAPNVILQRQTEKLS